MGAKSVQMVMPTGLLYVDGVDVYDGRALG
jgi:hypothetical protein